MFIKKLALNGEHPGESPGEEAGTGEAVFCGRFRQQDLGSLKLVEAENLIFLTTTLLCSLVLFCIEGQRLNGFNRRAETPSAVRSLSGQGCVSSHCGALSSPFPKPLEIRKERKMKEPQLAP